LKSAAYESLGKIKRQQEKMSKNMGWPNKTISRSKEKFVQEMAIFREARRQNEIQKKYGNSQKKSEKKTKSFLGRNI
jgi:hypothetical protein